MAPSKRVPSRTWRQVKKIDFTHQNPQIQRLYSNSIIGFLGRKAFRREVSNLAGTKNEPLKNLVFYFNYHVIIASMLASL